MSKVRQERTADQIQEILAEVLIREVSDPRLAGVTITDVEIDRELQYADVYVSALGGEESRVEVMAGLESAAGFLRRQVVQSMALRAAPVIRFQWDPRLTYVDEVDRLLEQLHISPAEMPPGEAVGSDEEE